MPHLRVETKPSAVSLQPNYLTADCLIFLLNAYEITDGLLQWSKNP